MKTLKKIVLIISSFILLPIFTPAKAQIIISEVMSNENGTQTYNNDWFELTNTGTSAVNITGWTMDDNSNSFANSVALREVTSIAAGQSVVFVEGNTSGSNDATVQGKFETSWFGTNVPSGFTIGGYGGSGVSLGSTGDSVNIFDSTGTLVTRVDFGAATAGVSFDNSAGLNNTTISTLSAVGTDGAFTAPSGEVGSPGVVPEPSTLSLLMLVGGMAAAFGIWKRKNATA